MLGKLFGMAAPGARLPGFPEYERPAGAAICRTTRDVDLQLDEMLAVVLQLFHRFQDIGQRRMLLVLLRVDTSRLR
jgi:hypothetical protein